MPAALPGDTPTINTTGNPNAGAFVIMDPLSGPKGSPLDTDATDDTASTGALSTGIGFGTQLIGLTPQQDTAPEAIFAAGFNDNMVPGEKVTAYAAIPPDGVVTTDIVDSTYMYIGGGRMEANAGVTEGDRGVPFIPDPYTAGIAIIGAGQGASRDGGAGPAYTGFPLKMATASGAVANGAAIEAGFVNRSGIAMVSGQSSFGSDATELAAAT